MEQFATEKICNSCKEIKQLSEFSFKQSGKSQRNAQCKKCRNKVKAEYDKHNSTNVFIYNKKYRQENAEKIAIQVKKYLLENAEKIAGRKRANVKNLKNSYVSHLMGMKVRKTPGELLELKRLQLQIHRHLKGIKNEEHK